ncbi:MAG TPA: protein phosphatase 2C domain-containing protein [Pseudonocardiaceae bacterium]|nr:protein phosphatase 2C domain-containing protein [Pseudonocardiaceae bacterium]
MFSQFCRRCAEPVSPQDRFCERCGAVVVTLARDRVEIDLGVVAGISDRGVRRRRNEDALALRDLGPGPEGSEGPPPRAAAVAVVCDGVSSSARPDEASETAAEVAAGTLVAALRGASSPVTATREAIQAADRAVAELAASSGASPRAPRSAAPACTFVSAVVTGETVTVGWVGDSRAYWIPRAHTGSPPARLTSDDSWLAKVVSAGTMTQAQAAADWRAHAITAWLGEDASQVDPHVITIEPGGPGVVVVCTDGLWNYLDTVDELTAALPATAFDAPLDAARGLVEIALRRGGHDNITVAVLPVGVPR